MHLFPFHNWITIGQRSKVMHLCSANAQTIKHQTTVEIHIKIMDKVRLRTEWVKEELVSLCGATHTLLSAFQTAVCSDTWYVFWKTFFFTGPPVQCRLSFNVCISLCVCMRVEWPPRRWSMPTLSLRNGGMCPRVGRPFPHLFPAQPSMCVRAHSQHLSLPNARTQWTLHIKISGPLRMCGGVGSTDVPLLRLPASVPLFVWAVCVCVLLFSTRAGMLFSAVSTVETPSDPVLHPAAPMFSVLICFVLPLVCNFS